MTKVLITGGAGFVGSHFVEHFLKNTDWNIVIFDNLGYVGRLDRLRDIEAFNIERVNILTFDFTKKPADGIMYEIEDVEYIFHLGGETHVDRSITDAEPFVRSNIYGTFQMLELARSLRKLKCFYYFSTDEVFGPAPQGIAYREHDRHDPRNPYAATKSSGEMLVKSYRHTHGLPAVITRSMNIFGERQHPEKFIPLCVRKILAGETIYIHSTPDKTEAGSRFYIHARNVADAYLTLVFSSVFEDDFHIVGEKEIDNRSLALQIGKILGLPVKYEMIDFHSSRPGHDLRYALDGRKLAKLGWTPPKTFDQSLEKTVLWSVENKQWLSASISYVT